MEDRIAKCRIASPIGGTVLAKYKSAGELVSMGTPLMKVANLDAMYLRAYFTSDQLATLNLGDEVEVPTLDGKVKYTIPEGTQSGAVFRMKGHGIPRPGGRGRGDQYVQVTVEIPRNLTKKQRELLEEFEELSGDGNYKEKKSFFEKLKEKLDID